MNTHQTRNATGTKSRGPKPKTSPDPSGAVRLHKILARTGALSLRAAERAIEEGRVSVNGKTVTEKGAAAVPERDTIQLDGRAITLDAPRQYLMMYKPKGIITTRADEKRRETVMDTLPRDYRNVYPVGRLDAMSEGLLLLTNDGEFCQAALAPKHKVPKVYHVKVRNIPNKKTLAKMVSGVTLKSEKGRGEKLKAEKVSVMETTQSNAWLEITLTEGKKRHIRRLCETLGHPAVKLKRVSIGPIALGGLKPGEVRHLPVELVNKLMKMAGYKKKER